MIKLGPPNRILSPEIIAALLLITANAVIPFSDVAAKFLLGVLTVTHLVFIRFCSQFILAGVAVIVGRQSTTGLPVVNLVLRGGSITLGILFYYTALQYQPLAIVVTLFASSPIVVLIIGALCLGEKVTGQRLLSVTIGFVGIVLVVGPGDAEWNVGLLFAGFGGVMHATYMVLTRKVASVVSPEIALCTTGAVGTLSTVLLFDLEPLYNMGLSHMVAVTVFVIASAVAQYLTVCAYGRAEATLISPLNYAEIPFAAILAWFVYSETVGLVTVIGIGLVVISGTLVVACSARQ